MSQCAINSGEVRSSAVVALQRLALASGSLSSLLRLACTARKLRGSAMDPADCSSSETFINYLHARVEDSARDTLLLSSVDKWACDGAYLNEPSFLICQMCTNPRESKESLAAGATNVHLRTRTGTSCKPQRPSPVTNFETLFEALLKVRATARSSQLYTERDPRLEELLVE